jgi:hypothetical protein
MSDRYTEQEMAFEIARAQQIVKAGNAPGRSRTALAQATVLLQLHGELEAQLREKGQIMNEAGMEMGRILIRDVAEARQKAIEQCAKIVEAAGRNSGDDDFAEDCAIIANQLRALAPDPTQQESR